MDLWIRSQDKRKLTPNPKLYADENGGIFEFIKDEKNDLFLGKYDTEERALEVLDEIQNFRDLINRFEVFTKEEARFRITSELLLKYQGHTVYEMPIE